VDTQRLTRSGALVDISVTVSPIRNHDGAVVGASKIARDITERLRQEVLRAELLEREQAARAEAVAARERMSFLAEVSGILSSSLDYEESLGPAVHIALPRLGD